jgi:flagellar hook-length control protein FliK
VVLSEAISNRSQSEKSETEAEVPALPPQTDVSDASNAGDVVAVAPPAAQPEVAPVPSPVPAAVEAADVAAAGPIQSVPAVQSEGTDAKPAPAVTPAVDAKVSDKEPVAAKDAAPPAPAVQAAKPAPTEPSPPEQAAQVKKPAGLKAETVPHTEAGKSAAPPKMPSPDRATTVSKPAAPDPDADVAEQKPVEPKPAGVPAEPAMHAASRDAETPDLTPRATAAQPSPDATANSAALPAPSVTHSAAHQAAQPSVHQPGPADTVPVSGLAVEIAAHAQAGKNRFEIRLDPPELGRIDVRLDVASDGQVTSHLRVERAETLDLLRRDAPALERALQQAGLKTSDNGLQFSLRDQSFSQHNQSRDMPAMARIVVPDEKLVPAETQRHYGRLAGMGSGVDIRV